MNYVNAFVKSKILSFFLFMWVITRAQLNSNSVAVSIVPRENRLEDMPDEGYFFTLFSTAQGNYFLYPGKRKVELSASMTMITFQRFQGGRPVAVWQRLPGSINSN
jgi:hypothetical protein